MVDDVKYLCLRCSWNRWNTWNGDSLRPQLGARQLGAAKKCLVASTFATVSTVSAVSAVSTVSTVLEDL